ncbi:MAG: hypothetical protein ACKOZV_13120 [Bacteroidota bacterium]
MTIEILKEQTVKLSRTERLEFLQFLANLLASEEDISTVQENQLKSLSQRREQLRLGEITATAALDVKSRLKNKYGLQD